MSTRALRRLRESKGITGLPQEDDDDDDGATAADEDDDDMMAGTGGLLLRHHRPSAFALHANDDDDSDSDDSDSDDDKEDSASTIDGDAQGPDGDDAAAKGDDPRSRRRTNDDVGNGDGDDTAPAAAATAEEEGEGERDPAHRLYDDDAAESKGPVLAVRTKNDSSKEGAGADVRDDDDWDAILQEFQTTNGGTTGGSNDGGAAAAAEPVVADTAAIAASSSVSSFLLEGLEWSDLDVDRARSSTLFAPRGAVAAAAATRRTQPDDSNPSNKKSPKKGNRGAAASNALLFGNPEPSWNRHNPPTFVGGGVGITTLHDHYQQRSSSSAAVGGAAAMAGAVIEQQQEERGPSLLPWPYGDARLIALPDGNEMGADGCSLDYPRVDCLDTKHWYTFLSSDAYRRDLADYRDVIERSGDVTTLLLFVVHHPYFVPALLQASAVLEQANRPRHALSMLKRALWVLDSAWQWSASRQLQTGRAVFVDGTDHIHTVDDGLNSCLFRALQALIKAGSRAGLPRTCWACCRLLLSLDPLRDPTGVLLLLDHYSLACNTSVADEWLVQFVESNDSSTRSNHPLTGASDPDPAADATQVPIRIWYRDEQDSRAVYSGSLRDMPNMLYSYALALYRLSSDQNHPTELKLRADQAMQTAIARFPSVVVLLLEAGDVDARGRTVRRDWMSVLDFCMDYDRTVRYRWRTAAPNSDSDTLRRIGTGSTDAIVRAATEQAVDHVSRIYARSNASLWSDEGAMQFLYDNLKTVQEEEHQHPQALDGPFPNPALMRYAAFAESDFDDRVQLLPPDAEVIDPELLEEAMKIDPNRRRLIRRPHRRRGAEEDDVNQQWFGAAGGVDGRRAPHWLGGPPTGVVDPDWPMVEVLWRSFLPWNRVEGVVPPRR